MSRRALLGLVCLVLLPLLTAVAAHVALRERAVTTFERAVDRIERLAPAVVERLDQRALAAALARAQPDRAWSALPGEEQVRRRAQLSAALAQRGVTRIERGPAFALPSATIELSGASPDPRGLPRLGPNGATETSPRAIACSLTIALWTELGPLRSSVRGVVAQGAGPPGVEPELVDWLEAELVAAGVELWP